MCLKCLKAITLIDAQTNTNRTKECMFLILAKHERNVL